MGLIHHFVVLNHFPHVAHGFLFFGKGFGKAHVIIHLFPMVYSFGSDFGGAHGLLQVRFFTVDHSRQKVDLGLE